MGIFDKFKRKPKLEVNEEAAEQIMKVFDPNTTYRFPESEDEPTISIKRITTMGANMVKVDVPEEDGLFIRGGFLHGDDKKIWWEHNGKILLEATNRSAAYKDVIEFANHKTWNVSIYKREGQHGPYYRVGFGFRVIPE